MMVKKWLEKLNVPVNPVDFLFIYKKRMWGGRGQTIANDAEVP